MEQLSILTKGMIARFHLMGGEPLLNPNCKDFFAIARKYFPDSAIWLITNGILLENNPKTFGSLVKKIRLNCIQQNTLLK